MIVSWGLFTRILSWKIVWGTSIWNFIHTWFWAERNDLCFSLNMCSVEPKKEGNKQIISIFSRVLAGEFVLCSETEVNHHIFDNKYSCGKLVIQLTDLLSLKVRTIDLHNRPLFLWFCRCIRPISISWEESRFYFPFEIHLGFWNNPLWQSGSFIWGTQVKIELIDCWTFSLRHS